jgi:2-aminoadipate transaminase
MLPSHLDATGGGALFELAVRRGVLFVPGAFAYAGEAPRNTLRLSFGVPEEQAIREGVARLAEAVRTLL